MTFLWMKPLQTMFCKDLHHILFKHLHSRMEISKFLRPITDTLDFRESNLHSVKHMNQIFNKRLQPIFLVVCCLFVCC